MEKLIGKIIRIDLDIYVINIQDTNNIVLQKQGEMLKRIMLF